jgi:Uma2 family endonuclease
MLEIVGEGPVRATYDQGTMEIFLPTFEHDHDAFLLGQLVCIPAEELDRDFESGGTTTHQRKGLGRGAEPDDRFWLGGDAQHMRGGRRLDLQRDRPPDLVIEVDVTRTSLDRPKIFAAMRVPEVRRSTGRSLQFLHRQADGTYEPRSTGRNPPTLTASAVARFLKEGRTANRVAWIRSFRAFVGEKVAPCR